MKKLLKKSLLVAAALLLGGVNVWAQDTYETVYTRAAVTDWTDADKTDWGGDAFLTVDATHGLFFNPTNPTRAYSASKSFSIDENAKVKYEVSWYTGSSTGRAANYEYIQFGDKVRLSWNSNYYFYLNTNGTSTTDQTVGSKGSNTTYTKSVSIVFNTATKKVESFTFDGNDLTANVADALEGNFNSLTFGFQRGGSAANWGFPNGLVTITVSQAKQAVTTANYTINYKLGDAVVKTVSETSVVGAEITAAMAIDGEGDYAGNHYVIVADAAPSMTLVAGENVLDVPVRAPYAATLKVTTTVNGTASEETINLTETDAKDNTYSYAYSKYVKSGDVYYVCDATTFAFNGTFTDGEVIEKAVTYTDADENIVFFAEAESVAGKDENRSWGGGGYVGSQNARDRGVSVGTLPAGHYLFTANILGANRRSLVLRQSTNDPMASVGTSNDDLSTGLKSAYFALTEETANLWINGANSGEVKTNQSEDYDYVVIRKIDEMVIVGDFAENGWNVNGIAMTQSNENEWTVVVENFEAEAKNYEYKALYHGTEWYGNSDGQNQNFNFNVDGYGAGTYTLTFTANTSTKTVEMTALKLDENDYYVAGDQILFDSDWTADDVNNKMTRNSDNTFTWTKEGVDLTAGPIEYKIVQNGTNWIPDGTGNNIQIEVKMDGKYDITIHYEPSTGNTYQTMSIYKSISDAGYATYYSPYDLNFEGTGVTAYVAAINGDEVSFEEVTSAKANTGLLLKAAEGGTYSLPMQEASSTATSELVGVLVNTTVDAGIFVLMNGNQGVGFYKTKNAFTVGANTAYLPAVASARTFIGFDGGNVSTAIAGVAAAQESVVVYNLKGQRVAQPTKGLYIVNGKKVMVK